MLDTLEKTWSLFKICWQTLLLDRELLLFPIISFVIWCLTAAIVATYIWYGGHFDALMAWLQTLEQDPFNPVFLAVMFGMYFTTSFIFIFFNAALIACAKIRFNGGDPTLSDGIDAAIVRLPQILGWSLLTSTVGFILQMLANKNKGLGRFIFGFLGVGWAVASYFAVPVLVTENTGPVKSLTRSVNIIKQTWGEALGAKLGFSALSFIIAIPMVLFTSVGAFVAVNDPIRGFTLIAIGLAIAVISSLILSTLGAILKAALYVYATEGKTVTGFDKNTFEQAFSNN